MYIFVYEALVDIERRMQEILEDISILKEQTYYTYDPSDADSAEISESLEVEREEAVEPLVNNYK